MYTLVLDSSYRPHRVVPWQRALSLLWGDKVEVIAEYDTELRSVSLTMRMPAVVRLLRAFKSNRKNIKLSRMNLFLRDKGKCQYCQCKLTLANKEVGGSRPMTYDHVVPKSRGGKTNWQNIVASCYPCNSKKRNRMPSEADMDLDPYPRIPRDLPEIAAHINLSGSLPDTWKTFLYTTQDEAA